MKTIESIAKSLNGKKIILRLDLNVPLNREKITDANRIDKIIPTLHFLIKNKAKILILSHVGRPKGKVIKELNSNGVKLNITAVYTHKQTRQILNKINKKTKLIISIFAGRAADTGKDPIPEFKKSIQMAKKFKNVEILWASVREPYNYLQAKQLGCKIITVPPNIIEKIENFGKSFDQLTKETVKAFLTDSKKSRFKI